MFSTGTIAGILVATLGGLAIGFERQWSGHASGKNARFGGIRTFTLLGGLAGVAGWLVTIGFTGVSLVLLAAAAALVVAGYVAASRHDVDATTEVAALVVLAAGVLAGIGRLTFASGMIAVTTLLLVEKSRLHAIVTRIDDEELRAAARFGVMAVVVLPLLPEGPFGPLGGIRPRGLWMLVLFFTGLSFAGYLARRIVGPAHGYPLAGLLGGLISSTNVTLTFARLSRHERSLSRALALGAIGACTMLFPRVLVATFALNRDVAAAFWPYAIVPLAVGLLVLVISLRQRDRASGKPDPPANALQIVPALQMAALFQVVLFVVAFARQSFGEAGLIVSGAVLGLTDVDALTVSMSHSASNNGTAPAIAARAIAVGILANSLLKTALALVFGGPQFRWRAAGVLAAMALAGGLSIVWF